MEKYNNSFQIKQRMCATNAKERKKLYIHKLIAYIVDYHFKFVS